MEIGNEQYIQGNTKKEVDGGNDNSEDDLLALIDSVL